MHAQVNDCAVCSLEFAEGQCKDMIAMCVVTDAHSAYIHMWTVPHDPVVPVALPPPPVHAGSCSSSLCIRTRHRVNVCQLKQ